MRVRIALGVGIGSRSPWLTVSTSAPAACWSSTGISTPPGISCGWQETRWDLGNNPWRRARSPRLEPWGVVTKSISDVRWAALRTLLEGKAGYAGRRMSAVPAQYTSQDCSGCGERVPKSLSVRNHVCTVSGLVLDHDENTAR